MKTRGVRHPPPFLRRPERGGVRPQIRAAIAAAVTALALSPVGAAIGAPVEGQDRFRVTIVGVDGATWRLLDPMLARGELPNFARLIDSGVRAPLRSRIPLWSPAVWTTIATGVPRERHGVSRFENAAGDLAASVDRRAPALWTIASAAGLRSAVIGWWVTYPAESINGIVISERALKTRDADLREMLGRPAARAEAARLLHPLEALSMVGDILGGLRDTPAEGDGRAAIVRNMRAEDTAVAHMLTRLRQSGQPFDLEMALLRGVDPISHHFWKFFEPDAPVYTAAERPTPDDIRRYGDTIETHYRYVDGLLGEIDAADRSKHVVMVLSDHGFEAGRQPFRDGELSGTHETKGALYGVFVASGGPIRQGAAIERATILDVAPTVLYLLGLPVAKDLAGRILTDILVPGWAETHPPRTVPSYPGPAVTLPAASAGGGGSPVDAELREQLRALGYLE
jgi:predicted AlkP superfamily phosphohydrolase/phosphomutase